MRTQLISLFVFLYTSITFAQSENFPLLDSAVNNVIQSSINQLNYDLSKNLKLYTGWEVKRTYSNGRLLSIDIYNPNNTFEKFNILVEYGQLHGFYNAPKKISINGTTTELDNFWKEVRLALNDRFNEIMKDLENKKIDLSKATTPNSLFDLENIIKRSPKAGEPGLREISVLSDSLKPHFERLSQIIEDTIAKGIPNIKGVKTRASENLSKKRIEMLDTLTKKDERRLRIENYKLAGSFLYIFAGLSVMTHGIFGLASTEILNESTSGIFSHSNAIYLGASITLSYFINLIPSYLKLFGLPTMSFSFTELFFNKVKTYIDNKKLKKLARSPKTTQVLDAKITVEQSAITDSKVDAILVPQFTWQNRGYVTRYGAPELQSGPRKAIENFDEILKHYESAVPLGSAFAVDANEGNSKVIIHGVSEGSTSALQNDDLQRIQALEIQTIATTVENAILAGFEKGARSFALPLLGTEVFGRLGNASDLSVMAMMTGIENASKKLRGHKINVKIIVENLKLVPGAHDGFDRFIYDSTPRTKDGKFQVRFSISVGKCIQILK